MDGDDTHNAGVKSIDESSAVVNSVILDYYKKFGRKRDLEQFFSLSTAETEVRDVTSLFWRRMKSHTDSSDSGEKKSKSDSSTELCRISIKCSLPEPSSSSQDETVKTKSDSESPPIITEEAPSNHSDDESGNEDNQSQKSIDATLDTSMNKPLSPTSSVTSQRKLEWDSLADVGYANESDRKTSASSLSTLERLALKQQYTNNDSKENYEIGPPTAHSTLMDVNENKSKGKKGGLRKTTKIYQKDVDIVEVSLPQGSDTSPSQPINVNLTKHISFNMEKDGGISLDNIKRDLNITPEAATVEPVVVPQIKTDKEIQTTLTKTKEESHSPEISNQTTPHACCQRVPVLINLNTLRKKYRKKKIMAAKRKLRSKKKVAVNKQETTPVQEKSTEQVSAAESFEYMPGHVYNQNHMNLEQPRTINMTAGNKSSLESSAAVTTTESSKDSRHSFTKDLEKSIDLLKTALRKSPDDSELKSKLIKEVIQRLLKSRYRDDESSTDFLSGLSFNSKKLGLGESRVTTSTSDSNNTDIKSKITRPKKSILRSDKFNPNILASTSQSAPNLPAVSNSEKPIIHNPIRNTESDISSGGKNSSETGFGKASSEELYQKYLEALKREEAYKRHLRDKEMFLKQKLVCSDTAFKVPQPNTKVNQKLKDLIKDLTRNNYDDGSGDASKLEGGSNSNSDFQRYNVIKKQRSHSVFTLSSGNSDDPNRKSNLKKKLQNEIKDSQASHSKKEEHYCCCPRHTSPKVGLADSSVQVNIKSFNNEGPIERQRGQAPSALPFTGNGSSRNSPRNIAHVVSDDLTGDIRYVCLCNKPISQQEIPENMLIYKCSRLNTKGVQLDNLEAKTSNTVGVQCAGNCQCRSRLENNGYPPITAVGRETSNVMKGLNVIQSSNSENSSETDKMSKTSQTNLAIKMLQRKSSELSLGSSSSAGKKTRETSPNSLKSNIVDLNTKNIIHEATRSVQTEISIDPQIPDPSLTDINIINDKDCVQLINERFRETSKKSSEADFKNGKPNDNLKSDTCSEGSARVHKYGRDKDVFAQNPITCYSNKIDKEVQSDAELNNNEVKVDINQHKHYDTDNFTIPIQGTNMTLMVRIGSKPNKNECEEKTDEFATQCVGTDKADVEEKATNLRGECSKGVQSQITDIFSSIGKDLKIPPEPITEDETPLSVKRDVMGTFANTGLFDKCCLVNTCSGGTARSTYPRNQVTPKPLLRSNTDTGRFVSGACIQTDSIDRNDAVTQGPSSYNSQKSKDSDDAKSKCTSEQSSKAESIEEKNDIPPEVPSRKSSSESDDPILDIIKDITKRFSKKDIENSKKKKRFKEIVTVLKYLLDTEEVAVPPEQINLSANSSPRKTDCCKDKQVPETPISSARSNRNQPTKVDKAVQLSPKKPKVVKNSTESSEVQATTDFPGTSSDSATCKVLSKIKRECEKYHQRRCKSHNTKKCDASSSTSVNCEQCKRVHHCPCRGHRCHKSNKYSNEKLKKKCVAYNLIIQTSDSMISEETVRDDTCKPLQNIVVKVPPKRKQMEKVPFNEVSAKIEKNLPRCSPRGVGRTHRSRSCPNDSEISSFDDYTRRNCGYTVRDYLEKNRPDFLEKTSSRQQCLKIISEKRANERAAHRQLLSAQLDVRPTLTALSETELRRLARDLGVQLRTKKLAPKFINEREMKKHSEKIYKSLPEVVQKKEEVKKENIKKTNQLMANIFKKNLQKKTLRGAVNISNYSAVIKI